MQLFQNNCLGDKSVVQDYSILSKKGPITNVNIFLRSGHSHKFMQM